MRIVTTAFLSDQPASNGFCLSTVNKSRVEEWTLVKEFKIQRDQAVTRFSYLSAATPMLAELELSLSFQSGTVYHCYHIPKGLL